MFKIPTNLEVRFINEEIGAGVFTTIDISRGSLIETCYCLILNNITLTHPAVDYVFSIDKKNNQLLAFGYGSIYNHDDHPNMICSYDPTNENLIRFYAIKDIKANEELRHSYGKKYWKARTSKII